jgi:hypothetical protein
MTTEDPEPVAESTTPVEKPPERLAPVRAQERLGSVDVLRGFALLGILAMNIYAFAMLSLPKTPSPLILQEFRSGDSRYVPRESPRIWPWFRRDLGWCTLFAARGVRKLDRERFGDSINEYIVPIVSTRSPINRLC